MASLLTLNAAIRPAAASAISFARSQGVSIVVTSVKRSTAEQRKLYADYLAGRSRFPAAPPGRSAHEFGLAWDSYVEPSLVDWWVAVRQAFGWHVPANDWVHAEVPNWSQYVRR